MEKIAQKENITSTYYLDNDVLTVRIKEGADITLEAAKEGVKDRMELQQGKPVLLLIDMKNIGQVHRDAREYAAKPEFEKMNSATALLVGKSMPAVIIANFYIKFNKPKTPTKLFKSEKKALAWLETFR